MMRRHTLYLALFFLMRLFSVYAQNSSDSLYTDEYINNICIREPERALRLMNEAELRKRRPLYAINYLRCLIYYNGMGQYYIALDYAKKAYSSDSIQNNPALKCRLLETMASACLSVGNYTECIRYTIIGAEVARQLNDKMMEANMLLQAGEAKREMGIKAEAEDYLRRAVEMQKEIVRRNLKYNDIDDLLYSYGALITIYQEDGAYQKAIDLLPEYERLMEQLKAYPNLPDGLCDMRYASEYAAFACIYAQCGEPDKAKHYYQKYLKTEYASTPEGKSIRIEYLLESKRYMEALDFIRKEKQRLTENGETLSYAYLQYALAYELKAYVGLDNYQMMAETYKQMLALTDSLNVKNKQNTTMELATIFKVNEKNEQIRMQSIRLDKARIILLAAGGMLVLSIIIIWLIIHNLRTTRMKNRVLVEQIDNLQVCYEELEKTKKAMKTLMPCAISDEETGNTSEKESTEDDMQLFKTLDRLVDKEKLFLKSDLCRDVLIKQLNIPKNAFAQLMQTYARTNFNGYINNKRLNYSISLLRDKANYTIQAVAIDSGFNNVGTYHRIFRDKYGITPTEYRENMKDVTK